MSVSGPTTPALPELGDLRRRLGMTKTALARYVGVRSDTVTAWERGFSRTPLAVLLLLRATVAKVEEVDALRTLSRGVRATRTRGKARFATGPTQEKRGL